MRENNFEYFLRKRRQENRNPGARIPRERSFSGNPECYNPTALQLDVIAELEEWVKELENPSPDT